GTVHCYVPLARHLGIDQPLYGIQSLGLENGNGHLSNIESMAASYLEELRAIQPDGPYKIAGYSMGAAVAYEMAVQLRSEGESVSLFLLDGGFNGKSSEQSALTQAEQLTATEREGLEELAAAHLGATVESLRELATDELMNHYLVSAKQLNLVPADISIDQFRQFLRVMASNQLALKSYRPQPYEGAVTLFRTPVSDGNDPYYGLGDLALGGVEVHEVPGNHTAFLEDPGVRIVAEKLNDYLLDNQPELVALAN
ncbi:MAG TPA: thioesterase domain-containing protein, partial [Pyrinomonadaceae bacterium]|nr:thioesterase domain-containing protein [Pyrinomonadaceae bacterium]